MSKSIKNCLLLLAISLLAGGGYKSYCMLVETKSRGATAAPQRLEIRTIPVVVVNMERRCFEEALKVQGDLESKYYALVSPRLAGTLEAVLVREGEVVVAGQTRLFQTDSLKAEQAVEIARQNLSVTKCSCEEKKAYTESIVADLRKAETELKRHKVLHEQKLTSPEAFEEKKANCERLQALKKYAESLESLARAEEKKAETAVAMSEKDLRDAIILAPINGKVSKRMAEPGEMGSPGVAVIRIDDVTTLEASAHLPSQYYAKVQVGQTMVRMGTEGKWREERQVSYKSPTVDRTLRTFEIKCEVVGNTQWAVPGAQLDMEVVFAKKEALAVPDEAVLIRGGRTVVFIADASTARLMPVTTGLETNGWVEVSGQGLSEERRVITKGQYFLNDGDVISLQKGVD